MTGAKSQRDTPGADRLLAARTCDVHGQSEDDVYRLEGPAGDVVACQRCIALLADQAGLTVSGPNGSPLA